MEKTITKYFLYDTVYGEYVYEFDAYTTEFTTYDKERLMIEDKEEAIITALLIQHRYTTSARNIEVYEVVVYTTKVERD